MKTKLHLILRTTRYAIAVALLSTLNLQLSTFAQGTAFTYQGRLQNNGSPASGTYNLTFTLFNTNTSGVAIAGPVTNNAVSVTNGLFTVLIDFGPGAFTGATNWLEIAVETNGVNTFTTLAPRQRLTPVPYAILAGAASGLSGTLPASQISGVVPLAQLPVAVLTNYATSASLSGLFAGNFGGSFYGNGGGLTGLNPANLTGIIADSQLSANIVRLNGTNNFTGTNIFAGVTVATNVNNFIVGAFIGNGGGLTNLNTGQFANSVLTNGETGVTLGGTFTGTGAGLTGLNPANLSSGTAAINISGNAATATTANSFSGSLSGDVTGTQGITVVSSVGGQTAANVAAGASAANAATSANTASTIVKRDVSGNFSAGSITLGGSLTLPPTTTVADTIYSGSSLLLYVDNNANSFVGKSGNSTTSGSYNTANGYEALLLNSGGSDNTANGYYALYSIANGSFNTAIGWGALANNVGGSNNIALGYMAGVNLPSGSSNIFIGNMGSTSGDHNTIRIGTSQAATFIAGIYGVTASGGSAVFVNSSGQLGTTTSSRRFKEAIQDMGGQSDVLLALRPVAFRYKPEIDPQGLPQFGLVAEEVEQVDPDLVVHDRDGKPYSVRYEQVNAMLLNEFLKQHRKVDEQNAQMQSLQQKNQSLEKRLAELETFVNKLAQTGK